MAGIYGFLGVSDTDRVFLSTLGQDVIYDAILALLERYNADLDAAMSIFIEREITDHKLRYKLPGGGRLQRLSGKAPSGAVRAFGEWDVAFPLEGFGAAITSDRIRYAYMSVQDLDRHIRTVFIQDVNTLRFELLKRLLNNTQIAFTDEDWGSLNIEPLANGDAVVYPPVLGSESEAIDDHYLISGYAATAISDANNPYLTIRDELEEHFGAPTAGSNIAVFINAAETPETEDLTDFDGVVDRFIRAGQDTDVPIGLPLTCPGRIVGRTSGVWVIEWRWVPASYMIGIHLDAPRPLMTRVDPADTGLPRGLTLVAEDEDYPLRSSYWEHRFGLGCGNRLNGVVMELDTGSYGIPTGYD